VSRLPKVAGIVLAAGKGTRMGQTKQLLPFQGRTILECVVDSALASSLHRVIVVIGHQSDLIEPLLQGRGVTVIVNPLFSTGQSSSLQAGLRELTDESEAALFLLGDQPLVTPQTIDRVIAAYQASRSPIVVPVSAGRRGNPALFSRETFPSIQRLSGDCGARPLFDEYAERLLALPVPGPDILFDVDTEEDYRLLLRQERLPDDPS